MSTSSAVEQLAFLRADLQRIVNGRRHRLPVLPFRRATWVVACYRLNRAGFLAFGRWWQVVRVVTAPLAFLLSPWTGEDLDHRADIGPGLLLLHDATHVVVNAESTIGARCTMVGGNVVGGRGVRIGDGVTLGANAVVLAPAAIASGSTVGAGAVVVDDFADAPGTLVGVPATRRPKRPPATTG